MSNILDPFTIARLADAINDKSNTFHDVVNVLLMDPYFKDKDRDYAEMYLVKLLLRIYGLMEDRENPPFPQF